MTSSRDDFTALDNPIWNALTSGHESLARLNGDARRYPSDVSPLTGLRTTDAPSFADLRPLVANGESVALFTTAPVVVPDEWRVVRARYIDQMVCVQPTRAPSMPAVSLSHADVPEMLALTAATEPGPFLHNTIRMGNYFGIRAEDGRLAAMAGQRLSLDHFTEISAVCTDPSFRGHGYAAALVMLLAHQILREHRTPFLHVKAENAAKVMYEKLGFTVRRPIQFTVLTPR